jgi:hypothetical protein
MPPVLATVHQIIIKPRGFDYETDQPADALGRADRSPASNRISQTKTYKEIARKQGLIRNDQQTLAELLGGHRREVALITLPMEVVESGLFLPGLGVNKIPLHRHLRRLFLLSAFYPAVLRRGNDISIAH